MPKTFILIPGRSSRQGVTLNEGKYTAGYIDETSTLRMNPDDMRSVGIVAGDAVRMWNDIGSVTVPVIDAKDECPPGLVFICYGDKSSQLMGGETHGSGMPDSKGLDVHIESVSRPAGETSAVVNAGGVVEETAASKAAKVTAVENETAAGDRPSSLSRTAHGFDREEEDSQPLLSGTDASTAGANRSPDSDAVMSTPGPNSSSVSSNLPKSVARKSAAQKKSNDQEPEAASMAQVFAIVLGLITILVLVITSGR